MRTPIIRVGLLRVVGPCRSSATRKRAGTVTGVTRGGGYGGRVASRNDSGSGIGLSTLVIASVSSMAAAIIVRAIWGPGAIISAAVTPVLVTLIAEALKRPTQVVSTVTAVRRENRPPAPMPPPSP